MIFTSYFANVKNIKNKQLISISRISPKWLPNILEAKELAPSSNLLRDYKNGLVSDEMYTKRYHEETLSKLNKEEIYKKYKNSVFLCYESSDDFCHRQIVAEWLRTENFKIEEIKKKKIGIFIDIKYNEKSYNIFEYILNKYIEKYPHIELYTEKEDIFSETFAKKYNIKKIESKNIWDFIEVGFIFTNKQIEENMQISYKKK